MALTGGFKRALRIGAVGAASALVLAACGSSSPSSSNSGSTKNTTAPGHVKAGGVAYWAELPAATPNWIFPFASLTYFSVANLTQFQYLMYRPLYWFGQVTSSNPTVDYNLSLADAPTWSNGNKTVTIKMKGWKYSNGTKVDAQSVMFWMNMIKAEKANWAGYAPGGFPDNVTSYSANASADTVTLNLDKAYSTNWYLYNELSQIDPMPLAWDITAAGGAPGSGGCSTMTPSKATAAACTKVWTFLTDDGGKAKSPSEAADLSTYATNPLWKVVDGPWTLKAFTTAGEATFVPNKAYSGPQKAHLSEFVELPFTSDTAEYSALTAGGSGAPNVGYIPTQDVPPNTGAVGTTGANASILSGNFKLVPVYDWGINYFPENFNSNGDGGNAGPIFRQLYIRQALQDLVNQTQIIQKVDKGYGVPTYGPVPVYPTNSFASKAESTNQYPFSTTKAKQLLSSHGWTVKPGGISVCPVGSKCGPGIKNGAQLNFTELYATGTEAITQTVTAEVSAWSQVGIHVSLKGTTFDNVLSTAIPCTATASDCSWEMGNWGGGWVYSPDYLPTGEEIFATGAGSNSGSYSNPTNDALINKTNVSSSETFLTQYENFLATNLPVIWQPNPASSLTEISTKLGGVTPINALLNLTPEYWYFKG
ncbi:MAG: ABC transporter substrate-binding protein [Acidimicrobiales bacterium]